MSRYEVQKDENEIEVFKFGEGTGEIPTYGGAYVITPKRDIEQTLQTKNKVMRDDVKCLQIPYHETENEAGGTTFIIAS